MTAPTAKDVLVQLNGLKLGELGRVDSELRSAGQALGELGEEALRERVEAARRSLKAGDLREFRRALATVTARLGHLK